MKFLCCLDKFISYIVELLCSKIRVGIKCKYVIVNGEVIILFDLFVI